MREHWEQGPQDTELPHKICGSWVRALGHSRGTLYILVGKVQKE